MRLLEITKGSWEHALYISMARNFGFHTNSVPFEELAINTPLSYLQKHKNNLFQLTALLMGQAGLIAPEEKELQKEYDFLRSKFTTQITTMSMRNRPVMERPLFAW